jgi:hypothetical protein
MSSKMEKVSLLSYPSLEMTGHDSSIYYISQSSSELIKHCITTSKTQYKFHA